jgi:hypothetical protein
VPTSVDLHDIKLRIFVYDRHTPSIQEMVDQVDIDKLKSYLDSIVGRRHYKSNPNHLIYVANYVNRFMIQNGLSIGHQFFKYNNIDFPNLIGRHEGLNNQNLCLINGIMIQQSFLRVPMTMEPAWQESLKHVALCTIITLRTTYNLLLSAMKNFTHRQY